MILSYYSQRNTHYICILHFHLSTGADLDRVSALFFLAYANSAGGVMKLLMATENGAQELRVKVREKGYYTMFSRLLDFHFWVKFTGGHATDKRNFSRSNWAKKYSPGTTRGLYFPI